MSQGGNNPFQNANHQLNWAQGGMAAGMAYQPMMVGGSQGGYSGGGVPSVSVSSNSNPYEAAQAQGLGPAGSYNTNTLQNTDLSAYMNPYTSNVIDASMADMERARQTALNNTGAQASAANAFGGSRHALMEARTNSNAIEDMGLLSAQLRQRGFDNAQRMAALDIGNQNQASQFNLGLGQSYDMANLQNNQFNASSQNRAEEFTRDLAQRGAIANMQARAQANALTAQIRANQDLANQRADQFGAQFRMDAANRMQNLGLNNFALGQTVQQSNRAQGNFERALQQGLLDRATQQFQGYQQAPYQGMGVLNAAFNPAGQNVQSSNPGLLDYAGLGLGAWGLSGLGGAAATAAPVAAATGAAASIGPALGSAMAAAPLLSDRRMKNNLRKVGRWVGQNWYTWDWTPEALSSGMTLGPTTGVIAQEVQETRPEAVVEHESGYLMVNYGKLA